MKADTIFPNYLKNAGLTLLVAFTILVMSAIPGEAVEAVGMGEEAYHIKGHFVMYGLLCLSVYRWTKTGWKSFLISGLYGTLMEIMQLYIPGRAFEYGDIFVNSLGALVAWGILWKRSLFLPKKLKSWLEN